MTINSRILIGWREWVALPDLALPAIKAKVDTGARTSALHAFEVEPFTAHGISMVRFRVHPLRDRSDLIVTCEAPLIDRRFVTDSGGHREKRYVIETALQIGGLTFPIEMTLTNRETMSHRMLLGRSAMKYLMIDPVHAFLLGQSVNISHAYRFHGEKKVKTKTTAQADSHFKSSAKKKKKKARKLGKSE